MHTVATLMPTPRRRSQKNRDEHKAPASVATPYRSDITRATATARPEQVEARDRERTPDARPMARMRRTAVLLSAIDIPR